MSVAVDEKEQAGLSRWSTEKDGECEGMEMTEATAAELSRLAEERANKIEDLTKTLRDLRDTNEKTKNKDIAAEVLIKSLQTCFEYKHGAAQQVLSGLKTLAGESVQSYKSFRDLLENDQTLSKYPDRVKGAQTVYSTYWSLLIETGPMLSVLVSKIKTAINTINEYKEDRNDPIEDKDDVDILIEGINNCVKALCDWQAQAHKIDGFSKKWGDLAKLAQDEEREWKEIHNKNKKNLKTKLNVWQRFLSGIRDIRDAANNAFAAAGNFSAEDVASGFIRAPLLLAVWPVGVGYGIYKAFTNYQESKKGLEAARKSVKNIEYVVDVMLKIGADASEISSSLAGLQENMSLDLISSCDDVKRNLKSSQQAYAKGRKKKLNRSLNSIDESFDSILVSMKPFQEQCEECIKMIKKSRKSIIELQKKHFKK